MFNNPGDRLKRFGKAIFVLHIVAYAVSGFAAFIYAPGIWTFFAMLIGIGLGIFIGWLASIFIVGFGELVETNTMVRDLMREMTVNTLPKMIRTNREEMKTCPSCHASNVKTAKFCAKCGSSL